jgi:prolipoprotein diacylglyceryltransferase
MLHAHAVFEFLAYTIGFQVYIKTNRATNIPFEKRIWIVIGAIAGAVFGSKFLFYFENPALTAAHLTDFQYLLGGKTIVGGLLGGVIGVEIAKKILGWTSRTGDAFVMPLIVGMSIGRIGCFLTGLQDDTCGGPTTWFTGVNFGDGIPRHPTQLYEIAFLLLLGAIIFVTSHRRKLPEGAQFQMFMFGYLLFRFGADFLKPYVHVIFGLCSIQIACILGMIYYAQFIPSWVRAPHSGNPSLEIDLVPSSIEATHV